MRLIDADALWFEIIHYMNYCDDILELIEKTPTVPQWIPVSERLPEENVDVLCQSISGLMVVASYGKLNPWSDEKGWISAELTRFHEDFFEAWMPLPNQYQGENR